MSLLHPTRDTNLKAQTAFGDAANSGDFAAFADLVAPDSVDHDPAPGQVPGPQGYAAMFGELRAAFPDMHIEVDHLVQDDDNVAFAYTFSGTHTGEFQGHGPTGKSFSIRGLQISRFVDGLMVERWGQSVQLGILTQLGLA
ncbi:MAG TPA: ester cyclase [Friedmanniella sp.]